VNWPTERQSDTFKPTLLGSGLGVHILTQLPLVRPSHFLPSHHQASIRINSNGSGRLVTAAMVPEWTPHFGVIGCNGTPVGGIKRLKMGLKRLQTNDERPRGEGTRSSDLLLLLLLPSH